MLNERNTLLEDDGIEEEILVEEECSVAQAVWGDIQGNIENQTDLQNALDAKQDSLTEAQLSAVNSGITSEKVTTYDGYADQIANKADQSALNAETIARGEADTALGTRIDNEALARQSADNGLQTQIDAITSKSDVVDVVANYAALQAYDTSTLGNNDVVKVLDDETHEDALTYYRWSTTTQTWSYIGQEAPYYSKGQMDVMLQGKQDTLTAGANIQIENGVISATDTKYTNGNGLNLNGTQFSADTDVLATKEDLESYYTKPETDNLLAPKLEAEVVAELPATGAEGKLYLTPKAHTTSTATGNPIEATITTQAGQLESFQLDGDTFQQSYTGVNLFDKSLPLSNTYYTSTGATATYSKAQFINYEVVPSSDKITMSYSAVHNQQHGGDISAYVRIVQYNSSGSFISRLMSADNNFTFTLDSNTAKVIICVDSGEDAYFDDLQLQYGSTATSYEPYTGEQPSPNPSYPQQIQTVTGEQTVTVTSKNLFSGQNLTEDSRVSTSNGVTYDRDGYEVSDYIEIEPSTNYALTCGNAQNGSYFSWYDSTKTYISGSGWQNKTVKTSPANASYIRFDFLASEVGIVQFEKGSVSSYVPYSNVSYPINLGTIELCKLGDYQDYIWKDGDDWKVHKATASDRMSSADNWVIPNPSSYPNLFQAVVNRLDLAPEYVLNSSALEALCDKLTYMDSGAVRTVQGFAVYNNEGSKLVRINIADFNTVTQLKEWLSSNDVEILFALATATDITITDTTLIAQLEAIRTAALQNGANTITNTATAPNLAGDMEVGYYGYNPTNRYDKFIWLDLNNNYEQIGS